MFPRTPNKRDVASTWQTVLVCQFLMVSPLVKFLMTESYPVFSFEVILVLVSYLSLATILAWAMMKCRWRWLSYLLLCVLLTYSLEQLFAVPLKVIMPAVLTAVWLLRNNIYPITLTAFGVLMISIVIFPPSIPLTNFDNNSVGSTASNKPSIVHLVLDEHISVRAISDHAPDSKVIGVIRSFYQRNGFELFGAAVSKYFWSTDSLPNLMNFTSKSQRRSYFNNEPFSLSENRYFNLLNHAGYKINVYQSSYLDYCAPDDAEINKCVTYSANSIRNIANENLSVTTKALLIVISQHTLNENLTVTAVRHYCDKLRPKFTNVKFPCKSEGPITSTLASSLQLPRIMEDVISNPTGHLFFAHLLVPHYPYVYNSACHLKNHFIDWLGKNALAAQESEDEESAELSKHLDQVECLYVQLQSFINGLKRKGFYDRLVFIVHGDHGARISLQTESNSHDPQIQINYIIKNYSTIYATKTSSQSAGYESKLLPLDTLFAHTIKKIMPAATILIAADDYVYKERSGAGFGGEMFKLQIPEHIEARILD